jgi:hypothetical protein
MHAEREQASGKRRPRPVSDPPTQERRGLAVIAWMGLSIINVRATLDFSKQLALFL